jgi:hypothetical protein
MFALKNMMRHTTIGFFARNAFSAMALVAALACARQAAESNEPRTLPPTTRAREARLPSRRA